MWLLTCAGGNYLHSIAAFPCVLFRVAHVEQPYTVLASAVLILSLLRREVGWGNSLKLGYHVLLAGSCSNINHDVASQRHVMRNCA